MPRKKVVRYLAFLVVAVAVAAPWWIPWLADWYVISMYGPQIPFDPAGWRAAEKVIAGRTTDRQRMVRDLVLNVLPGKTKAEIERLLGPSPAHAEMRRYSQGDFQVREKDERGEWKPFPRTGKGHYFDEFDWDLL